MSILARFKIDRQDFRLDVNLELPGRGVTAIFGPSGSGKTTLLRAIAGLENSPNGYLRVANRLWQEGSHFVQPHLRAVGYVFQEPSLFAHLNARSNIEYGRRRVPEQERKIPVEGIIELLGIAHLLHRHPHQMSGGEQQRVAIARALATSPAVLLMDEPLASLDAARKREILPYFESLHRELDIPILYVSHFKDEVLRMGDFIVLLDDGRVTATGPVTKLFSRLDLPPANEPDAQFVIETVVAGQDEQFGLTYLDFPGGRFAVAGLNLSAGHAVRLLIRASDVSITLERASQTSILNIVPAVVEEIAGEAESQVTVRLTAGSSALLARITRKSAAVLGLHSGMNVFAQIKTVALLR